MVGTYHCPHCEHPMRVVYVERGWEVYECKAEDHQATVHVANQPTWEGR